MDSCTSPTLARIPSVKTLRRRAFDSVIATVDNEPLAFGLVDRMDV